MCNFTKDYSRDGKRVYWMHCNFQYHVSSFNENKLIYELKYSSELESHIYSEFGFNMERKGKEDENIMRYINSTCISENNCFAKETIDKSYTVCQDEGNCRRNRTNMFFNSKDTLVLVH